MDPISNEDELLRCFRDIDRADVELGPEVVFPLVVADAVAWKKYGKK